MRVSKTIGLFLEESEKILLCKCYKNTNKTELEPRLIKSVRLTNHEYIYARKRDAVITRQKAWCKDMG